MDNNTKRDIESMAEWAEWRAALELARVPKSRQHNWIRFWLNCHQVVYEPTVAEPASEESGSPSTSGAGPGAVRVESETVDPSRVGGRGAPRTALPPLTASRISAGITWQ